VAISRRGFLGAAAGLAACTTRLVGRDPACASALAAAGARTRSGPGSPECVLVDSPTPLRESIAGYEVSLVAAGCTLVKRRQPAIPDLQAPQTAIVPGCVALEAPATSWLLAMLEAGGMVLIESGVPFAEPADFARHRQLLESRFGVDVGPPVNLWAQAGGRQPHRLAPRRRVPYIDYVWPGPTKIRDFSRVTPVRQASEKVVAWAGDIPVAVRIEVRRGTLIYLGSPLGPALLSGDREAHEWLCAALGIP
jgi:hypothetical protein